MDQQEQKRDTGSNLFVSYLERNKPINLPDEVPSRKWMYWNMVAAVTRKFIRSPFSIHTWAALNRATLSVILPDNLIFRFKAYQVGECNRCGLCCKIQFQCPFFVDEGPLNTHCMIYTSPHVPIACVRFPLNPMDLHMLQREIHHECVFYFEGLPKLTFREFARMYKQGIQQQIAKRKLKEVAGSAD